MDVNSLFVFCLEMKPKEKNSDEENKPYVAYSYPRDYSSLQEIESMLAVLCHVSEDLTGKPADTSVLTDRQGKHMWVKYLKKGHKTVIFVAKSEAACSQTMTSLFKSVMRLIFILYGSIENAFFRKKFHGKLNGIFSSAEEKLRNLYQPSSEVTFTPGLEYIPMYSLPLHYQDNLSRILSVIESKQPGFQDFKTGDHVPHDRGLYYVLGSCVFFNEYLLCSHLSPKHLEDVHIYLKYNRLLSEQVDQQIVLWREIHLAEDKSQKDVMLGYIEQPFQCFALVVCQRPYFMATLLQSPKPFSIKNTVTLSTLTSPPPPPLYIERLKAALSQIESTITGFYKFCMENNKVDEKMKNPSFADQIISFFKSPLFKQKKSCNLNQNAPDYSGYADISNLTLSPTCIDSMKHNLRTISYLDSKYSTYPSVTPASFPDKFTPQSDTKYSCPPQEYEDRRHLEMKLCSLNLANLTWLHSRYPCCSGVIAILYMCGHKGHLSTGVHINGCCGIHTDIKPELSRCCSVILANFKTSKLFGKNQKTKQCGKADQTLLEYGVLLQKQSLMSKQQQQQQQKGKEGEIRDVWVVGKHKYEKKGRLQQIVFVCFQNGVEQSATDLAFNLPFGHNWMG
ncbi:protein inturned-like [Argonauta hians]